MRSVHSNKLRRQVYSLIDVPGRTAIHIHAANSPSQLQGCIAPFLVATKDKNGGFYATKSGNALQAVEHIIASYNVTQLTITA